MGIIAELQRRNVFRVGIAYLVLGWLMIQVTATVSPALNLPEWMLGAVTWLGIIGFPFALLFAWAFELTPDGLKRENEVDRSESITDHTGRKVDFVVIGMLVLALLFMVLDNYVLVDTPPEPAAALEEQPDVLAHESVYDSIGVLPFANMSNDPEQDYFSDGIAEELLNALAKLKKLHVASRTSSFAFKGQNQNISDIGNQLKVDTMLEGSVRRSGSRLRITAQLIEVENGYHLWSETYDRELTDVFAVQDELTAAIVDALKIHLDVGEEIGSAAISNNVEAFDAYLKGRHAIRLRTSESVAEAISQFEAAIKLEPTFADALARLAQAVLLSVAYGDTPEESANTRAGELLDRALKLNPDLAEAHTGKGYMLSNSNECGQAIISFDRALATNPELVEALHWKALCLQNMGRLQEARVLWQRAHFLEPQHAAVFSGLSGLQITYGIAVDLNTEIAKEHFPRRYLLYQMDKAYRDNRTAEVNRLSRTEPQDSMLANWELRTNLRLKQKDDELIQEHFEKLGNVGHDFYMLNQILYGDFEEAERHLKSLVPGTLTFTSDELYLGFVQYRSGNLAEAEARLSRGLIDASSPIGGSFNDTAWSNVQLWLSLADTFQRNGKREPALLIISRINDYIKQLKDSGATTGYKMSEARLRILENKHELAVSLISDAKVAGKFRWYWFDDPVISQLATNPEFIMLKAEVGAHIDAERAKLGWPPAGF
jgi:TolB-like protein